VTLLTGSITAAGSITTTVTTRRITIINTTSTTTTSTTTTSTSSCWNVLGVGLPMIPCKEANPRGLGVASPPEDDQPSATQEGQGQHPAQRPHDGVEGGGGDVHPAHTEDGG
jgi:hypothetical protein